MRKAFTLLISICLVFTMSIIAIAEGPTPEPTPEPTEEPTPEPSPEPTLVPTPEPTEEPTPEPFEEPDLTFGKVREVNAFDAFQPFTSVDLSLLKQAGFSVKYDDFQFAAEFYPPNNILTNKGGSYDDKYTIKLDIKAIYSAGELILVPRMIFSRSGFWTYYDNRMSEIYIRNGENRYRIDLTGVTRSSNSKYSTATDTSVEPICLRGSIMLGDLATNPKDVYVRFGSSDNESYMLNTDEMNSIKVFFDTCKAAGIFEQDHILNYTDNYSIITLFNNGSTGTEDSNVEEIIPKEDKEIAENE